MKSNDEFLWSLVIFALFAVLFFSTMDLLDRVAPKNTVTLPLGPARLNFLLIEGNEQCDTKVTLPCDETTARAVSYSLKYSLIESPTHEYETFGISTLKCTARVRKMRPK